MVCFIIYKGDSVRDRDRGGATDMAEMRCITVTCRLVLVLVVCFFLQVSDLSSYPHVVGRTYYAQNSKHGQNWLIFSSGRTPSICALKILCVGKTGSSVTWRCYL